MGLDELVNESACLNPASLIGGSESELRSWECRGKPTRRTSVCVFLRPGFASPGNFV